MPNANKLVRKVRCTGLSKLAAKWKQEEKFFTEEKLFLIEQVHTSQKDMVKNA